MTKKVKRNCDVGKTDRRTITLLRELLCARGMFLSFIFNFCLIFLLYLCAGGSCIATLCAGMRENCVLKKRQRA